MIALLLCLVAASADSSGLEGRRVVVVPAVGAAEPAEFVTAALQARGLVPVVASARAGIDGVVVDVVPGDREQIRALLQHGRTGFRELDLEAAESRGRAALEEGLRLQRPEDEHELLVEVLLFLAAVRLSVDANDDDGARFLRLASRLEPTRLQLDPGLYAPSAVAAWTGAREKNASAEAAVVVVAPRILGSEAQKAEVVVDGVVTAPAGGLLLLPHGPHLFTLRAPGCDSISRILDVSGSTPPLNDLLAPAGDPARRKLAASAIQAGDADAFAVVAGLVDADVVVALSSAGKPRAWRNSPRVLVEVAADPTDPAAFAQAVLAALAEKTVGALPPPLVGGDEPPAWLLGVGVGVSALVVAGTGVLAVVLLLPGDVPPPPPRPVPVGCCVF